MMPTAGVPRIALVGCSAKKRADLCLAKDMYTGTLFRAARAYAEANCTSWAILSAKYGILDPDNIVEPYDQVLPARQKDIYPWACRTNYDAWMRWYAPLARTDPDERPRPILVLLCGANYRSAFDSTYGFDRGMPFEAPLARLGIGKQLQWLQRNTRRPK